MILLYGHPRTGKSHLLQQIGLGQDLDALILQHAQGEQTSLKHFFLNFPEQFQFLESHLLHQSTTKLMALGGSTLLRTSAPKGALIIYLYTPYAILEKRWLTSKPAALEHQSHQLFYEQRHLHYLKQADLILPSDSAWNVENIKRIIRMKT